MMSMYQRISELRDQGFSHFYATKRAEMESKIQGWQRLYSEMDVVTWDTPYEADVVHSAVRFLVLEEKRTTRSPGKLAAINAWLEENP